MFYPKFFIKLPTWKFSFKPLSILLAVLLIVQLIGGFLFYPPLEEAQANDVSWYDSSWKYRKKITIDADQVTANLTDFPVLISTTDSDLMSKAQSNGNDILFISADGATKLNHEIENYTSATGQLTAWIKSDLSSTTDTVLYMYYGNGSSSDQSNATGVWDSNFQMVQHLEETSGGTDAFTDSTSNSNHGTDSGNPTASSSAKIDGAWEFDGSGDYILSEEEDPNFENLWTKSDSNPLLSNSKFGSIWKEGNNYYLYYVKPLDRKVYRSVSTDKINFTSEQLVMEGDPVGWDKYIDVVNVWKEDSTWYMLYRGTNTEAKVGLATSSDGGNWNKYASNPLTSISDYDATGLIKVDSTYYLFANGNPAHGITNLYTSEDLINWTANSNNPIFASDRFCPFVFKHGGYYYMIITRDAIGGDSSPGDHYFELYRDTNPTFYPQERDYLGVISINDQSYDSGYLDVPMCIVNDIYRDSFPTGDELWCYYSGRNGAYAHSLATTSFSALASRTVQVIRNPLFNQPRTICAWIYPKAVSDNPIFSVGSTPTDGSPQSIFKIKSGKLSLYYKIVNPTYLSGNTSISVNVWTYACFVYDGSAFRLYKDGASDSDLTTGTDVNSIPNDFYIGSGYNSGFNGIIDEFRISNTARSAQWIETEYNNQSSPSIFYSIGSEQTIPTTTTGGGLVYGWKNPPIPGPHGDFRVIINNNDTYTTSRDVTLTLEAGYNVKYVAVSEKEDPSDDGFEAFEPEVCSKPFTLSLGDGLKKVYAQFLTAYNRFSEVVHDDIILDTSEEEGVEGEEEEETTQQEQEQEQTQVLALLKAIGGIKVYQIINNLKHWIPNPDIFNSYGFKWSDIQEVEESELDQYSQARLLRPEGDIKVYYLTDIGQIRHIPSPEVFNSYNNKWDDVIAVSQQEINSYPINNLIRLENGIKVYKLENYIKRWITTAEVFNRLKYDWNKIAPVNQTELNYYPEGIMIK